MLPRKWPPARCWHNALLTKSPAEAGLFFLDLGPFQSANMLTSSLDDTAMLTSMKLGLATTVAALWIAAFTFAGAGVTSVQSTSVASAPAATPLRRSFKCFANATQISIAWIAWRACFRTLCAVPEFPKAPGSSGNKLQIERSFH